MRRIRVFRYLKELDAFEPSPDYRALADDLGIAEWNRRLDRASVLHG